MTGGLRGHAPEHGVGTREKALLVSGEERKMRYVTYFKISSKPREEAKNVTLLFVSL